MWCKWWFFFLAATTKRFTKGYLLRFSFSRWAPIWAGLPMSDFIIWYVSKETIKWHKVFRRQRKKQNKTWFSQQGDMCITHIKLPFTSQKNQVSIEWIAEGALIRIKCRTVLLRMRYLGWAWVLWHVSWLGRQSFGRRCRPGPSRSPPGQSRREVWQLVSAASWPTDCQPGGRSASRRHRSPRRCWNDRRWRRTDASLKSL